MILSLLAKQLILCVLFFIIAYIICQLKKDISKVDIFWSLSFLFLTIFHLKTSFGSIFDTLGSQSQLGLTSYLVLFLVFIWATRLSLFILFRNSKIGEDRRYLEMKSKWDGNFYIQSFLRVFMIQALLAWIISWPLMSLSLAQTDRPFVWTISCVSLFAIIYESIADIQKYKFKQVNKTGFIQSGLYKYSRYPNYFGEILFWWSLSLMLILSLKNPLEYIWFLFSPLFLTILIIKVSGVALLEKNYLKREGYTEYRRKTNMLIPFFRKR